MSHNDLNKLMSELIYILQLLWLCLRVVFHSTCKNILHRNTFQENLFRYWNNLICITVGISNGVAIPAKSSVTNKRAQFVVLESKKTLDFFSRNDALGISQKVKGAWSLRILKIFFSLPQIQPAHMKRLNETNRMVPFSSRFEVDKPVMSCEKLSQVLK